jgi:hypothetical protein
MIQDWANNNAGSIELSGNLAAVGQRHLAIQQQARQIAALHDLADIQRQQAIEKAQIEERQNALYSISAALKDIKKSFESEPSKAYFEFLVLDDYVSQLGLDHRMFPSLEWKEHCNKTLDAFGELRQSCKSSVDPKAIEQGLENFKQHKVRQALIEEEIRKQEVEEARKDKALAQHLKDKELIAKLTKRSNWALIFSIFCFLPIGLILGILVLKEMSKIVGEKPRAMVNTAIAAVIIGGLFTLWIIYLYAL